LSPPKSKTATALFESELLYIKAPLAVIVADVNEMSAKSQIAVVPDVVGVTLVKVPPPELYVPEFETSFDVLKAVVVASKLAELVYSAILKVSPDVAVKL
jgi:hypothetical protein